MSQFTITQVGYLSQCDSTEKTVDLFALQVDLTIGRPPIQMAEIWPPGIFLQYIWTCRISASYLVYIRNSINEVKNCI